MACEFWRTWSDAIRNGATRPRTPKTASPPTRRDRSRGSSGCRPRSSFGTSRTTGGDIGRTYCGSTTSRRLVSTHDSVSSSASDTETPCVAIGSSGSCARRFVTPSTSCHRRSISSSCRAAGRGPKRNVAKTEARRSGRSSVDALRSVSGRNRPITGSRTTSRACTSSLRTFTRSSREIRERQGRKREASARNSLPSEALRATLSTILQELPLPPCFRLRASIVRPARNMQRRRSNATASFEGAGSA